MITLSSATKKSLTKVLSVTTTVTTTLWVSGAALLAPMASKAAVTINEGDIFRASNDYKVYIAKYVGAKKIKRWFVGPQMFDFYKHLSFAVVKVVDPSVAATFTESKLVRMDGDDKVYNIGNAVAGSGAQKQWVNSLAAFQAAGFDWDGVFLINAAEHGWYTDGGVYGGGPVVTPVGGTIGASLASDNPAGAVIASGSLYNNVLKVTFVGGPASITGLTVTKYGLIANSNVTGLSVWDANGMRHGSVVTSLSSDNKATIGFGNDPIVVNGSATVTIAANLASGATSGTFYMGITSAADVQANGSVGGAFPLMGNIFTLADGQYSLGDVWVEAQSPAGNAASTDAGNTDVGDLQKEIAKFKFTQNNSNEAIKIEALTMYVEGDTTESSDVKNWKLYDAANNVLATAEKPADRMITFMLSNGYTIDKGLSRVLSVKADFLNGSSRWVRVQIQNDYDVKVKGLGTNAYVQPKSSTGTTFATPTVASNAYFKVRQGTLSVTKSADSPSSQVAAGASEAVLAKFTLRASGEDMEVRKMDLYIPATVHALTGNVSVRSADGSVTYLTTSAATGSTVYVDSDVKFDLSTYMQLKSNVDTVIAVYGNVSSNATAADSYQANVKNFYVKRLSSIDYTTLSTSYSPANVLAVGVNEVTVARNTSFGDSTAPPSLVGAKIGSFMVQGGTAEDARISSIQLKGASSTSVNNLVVKVAGVQQGSTVSAPTLSGNTFSVSINVPKSTPVTVDVYGDVVAQTLTTATGTMRLIIPASGLTVIGLNTSNTTNPPASELQLQTISFGAGTLTVSKDSSSPTEQILTPANGVLMGNWKFAAANEDLKLSKVTFRVLDGTASSAGAPLNNFGTMYLKDGSTTLASASLVNNDVLFSGFNLTIPASGYKVLSLYADLTGSGNQVPGSIAIWTVKSDTTPTDIDVTGSSGSLGVNYINGTGANTEFAASNKFLYHNSKPVIAAKSDTPSGSHSGQSADTLFIFTITNSGTRDMRVQSLSVTIAATAGTSGADGDIDTVELYDGTQKIANGTNTGVTASAMGANSGSVIWGFSQTNDVSSYLDNFVITAGSYKHLTVKANTSAIRGSLGSGQYATVSSRIAGTTGAASGSAWNTGNIEYYYTPVFGTEQGPFYASDSFTVNGGTLTY
jgi:hypothetical protein